MVSERDDPSEVEAERVADRVVRGDEPAIGRARLALARTRGCGAGRCPDEDDREVARKESGLSSNAREDFDPDPGRLGSGSPLPHPLRSLFEPRFGHDFSNVRIHTGHEAARAARSVDALAYTVGRDIVFGAGTFAPATSEGQTLIAHELVHVLQQSGDAGPASLPRMSPKVQRAISPELEKIEGLLSYGLIDWAITDEEATQALELLKRLPKYQQAVFFSEETYPDRLRSNLPDNRIPELDDLQRGVADIAPPREEMEEMQDKLSYGLFDWAVTDEEAIAVLEKLKRMPEAKLSVALSSINYGRLLDNLPDNRKQELRDLLAKHLAAGGTRTAEEAAHPGSTLASLSFKSDHGVMRDNAEDWTNSGSPYGEPEWFLRADGEEVSKPISQSRNTSVSVEAALNVSPVAAPAAPMELRGESSDGFLRFVWSGTMAGGLGQRITMTSASALPDQVAFKEDRMIRWRMKWRDWDHEIASTRHSIFVTMDTPRRPAEVTYKRMALAVSMVQPPLDPRGIVRRIMSNWTRYNLAVNYSNPWLLADDIAKGADCITIVRFVRAVIETVGCPGTTTAVVISARPWSADVPLEEDIETISVVGLHAVGAHPAHPTWHAGLLDGDWHSNAFEAALKFDSGGLLSYYPGGVTTASGLQAEVSTPLEVLHVFKCLAWVTGTGGSSCRIMEVPPNGDYPLGPCPVGEEHECYV